VQSQDCVYAKSTPIMSPRETRWEKTDAARISPIQYGGYNGTRLSHEGQHAVLGSAVSKARIQPDPGDEDSETVRPDDAQLAGLDFLGKRML
jgi:hypothetical protein